MTKLILYFGIFLLVIYIVSPIDAHPLFLDDIIASGALFYMLYRYAFGRKPGSSSERRTGPDNAKVSGGSDELSLEEAHRILGVTADTPREEVKKAYKEKISGSHPDKVSHLDRELQEKAAEVSLRVNTAMEMIRKQRAWK